MAQSAEAVVQPMAQSEALGQLSVEHKVVEMLYNSRNGYESVLFAKASANVANVRAAVVAVAPEDIRTHYATVAAEKKKLKSARTDGGTFDFSTLAAESDRISTGGDLNKPIAQWRRSPSYAPVRKALVKRKNIKTVISNLGNALTMFADSKPLSDATASAGNDAFAIALGIE